jgi:hypothetical protein
MKCDAIQEQLLQCEEPARPPAALLRHLTQCAACRAFRQQLLELEDGVRRLSVPRSALRDRLVARLQEGELPTPAGTRPSAWRSTLKERAQQKLALALTLAASLALFALGWGMWPHGGTSVRDPHGQSRLAATTEPGKVRELAEHLRRLEQDVLTLRLPVDQLEAHSGTFVEFAEEELPLHAERMTRAERAALLPAVLAQLQRSESTLLRACAEQNDPPESLRRMAAAARTGQVKLRALLA